MKFELPSRGKIFDLKHSAALNLFQKKLCYRCNYLGVVHFEYIGSVRRDGKFAGSMINHFSQKQMTAYAVRFKEDFARLLLIYSTFILCKYSTLQHVSFSVNRTFCKDIYNSWWFHFQMEYWWFLKNIERPQILFTILSINVYPNVGKGLRIQVIKKHLKYLKGSCSSKKTPV